MQKFMHNVALSASLIALAAGLWQDWGIWLTVKRMLISYLGFFCGSFLALALAIKVIPLLGENPEIPAAGRASDRRPDN